MNIVLIGIQGCGKGTLLANLEGKLDFSVVSVGQLLRDEVATGSEIGKRINEMQSAGLLVDNDITINVLKKKLNSDNSKIKFFDGFPRTLVQAEELDKIAKVDLVIHLDLSKQVAIERLLNRLTCKKCGYITQKSLVSSNVCPECSGELAIRSDDNLESIEKRFKIFETETYPLLERYKKLGVRVERIDSSEKYKTLEAVLKVINEYNY